MANPSVATIVKQALEPVAIKIKNDPNDQSVIPAAAENATYLSLTGDHKAPDLEAGRRHALKEILSALNEMLDKRHYSDESPALDEHGWAVRYMQWTLLRFARVHGINAVPLENVTASDRAELADAIEMHVRSAKASYEHFTLVGKFGKRARAESEDEIAEEILKNFLSAVEKIRTAIAKGLTDANNIFRIHEERVLWDGINQNCVYIAKHLEDKDKAPKGLLQETEFGKIDSAVEFVLELATRIRRSRTYREPVHRGDYQGKP